MTKIYVREPRRAPRRNAGDAPAPQSGKRGNPAAAPAAAKAPSYLAQVKAELTDLVAAAVPELPSEYLVAALWPFFSEKLRQSFWNGVRGGASGTVKPKAPRGGAQSAGD